MGKTDLKSVFDVCLSSLSDTSRADSDEWYSSPAVEEAVGSDCVWSRFFGPVQVGSVILLPPLSQLPLSVKHFWQHNNGKPIHSHTAVK